MHFFSYKATKGKVVKSGLPFAATKSQYKSGKVNQREIKTLLITMRELITYSQKHLQSDTSVSCNSLTCSQFNIVLQAKTLMRGATADKY